MITKNYRPCVGLALFNAQGEVFVGERIDTPGAWQMPQGGIDEGENIEAAAFRELFEETGLSAEQAHIIKIAEEKIAYDLPDALIRKLWNGYYHGQEQTWIALRFSGNDTDIRLDAHAPAEFAQWQWVPLSRTVDLIVPFKRETYRKVIDLFADIV